MLLHYLQVLVLILSARLVTCEPPVKSYLQPPRNNFNTNGFNSPTNSYLPPSTGYNTPRNNYLPPNSISTNSGHDAYYNDHHRHGHDNEVPKSYEFGYSVKDAQSGNDYDRRESSDGNVVRGEYRVQLPDGRMQIVTYHADWQTGFHADVRYEGEARYPELVRNTHQQAGYNYNPTGDFSGSLTGFHGNAVASNQGYKQPSTAYGPPGYH